MLGKLHCVVALAALATACTPMPPMPPKDATEMQSGSGAPLMTRDGRPITQRDWNCPRCYK